MCIRQYPHLNNCGEALNPMVSFLLRQWLCNHRGGLHTHKVRQTVGMRSNKELYSILPTAGISSGSNNVVQAPGLILAHRTSILFSCPTVTWPVRDVSKLANAFFKKLTSSSFSLVNFSRQISHSASTGGLLLVNVSK